MRKIFICIALVILLSSSVSAQKGTIKLLAVSETPEGMAGSMADLTLEIKDGDGRVFIDTLPASKLDTQMTTRFARDIACKYLKVDCSRHDFFYTIRADSTIIGGPSAGAATAILTISLLGKIKLDSSTVITGTINSGYLLGSVGGVKQKIDVAAGDGIKKVIIPETEISFEEDNKTTDYVEYGRQKNITVVRATDIDGALYEFTGKKFKKESIEVEIDQSYVETMALLAGELCNRTAVMSEKVAQKKAGIKDDIGIVDKQFIETEGKAINLTVLGTEAYKKGMYYSAASYCFGANVNYHYLFLRVSNTTSKELADAIEKTDKEIKSLNDFLNSYEIQTITDLQAYMVSKERLVDSTEYLNRTIDSFKDGMMNESYMDLAYSIERIYSAYSWSRFLGKEGKKFELDKNKLMESCMNKVNEAEEYFQYIQLIFPGLMQQVGEEIDKAERHYAEGNYELCLHTASLAKAEVTIVLSTIGFKEETLHRLLDMKLDAAKNVIVEHQKAGIFPIVGYSYYEYAQSLSNDSIYSALLYSEYSLELSSLDIYFEPKKAKISSGGFSTIFIFLAGIIIGMIAVVILSAKRKPEWERRKRIRLKTPAHKRIKFDFSRRRGHI